MEDIIGFSCSKCFEVGNSIDDVQLIECFLNKFTINFIPPPERELFFSITYSTMQYFCYHTQHKTKLKKIHR